MAGVIWGTALWAVLGIAAGSASVSAASSADSHFWVSVERGRDSNSGSQETPFGSVQHCVNELSVGGGTCSIEPGVYRESVIVGGGTGGAGDHDDIHGGDRAHAHVLLDGASVELVGTAEGVVLSGLDQLRGLTWTPVSGMECTYTTPLPAGTPRFEQLFHGGLMMVEARWPNLDFSPPRRLEDAVLDRDASWRPTGQGTVYGEIVDEGLAAFDFSWDGALATLNVAHQFFTWTRVVSNHSVRGRSFSYPKDLPGLAEWSVPGNHNWANNQYFLSGKLGALDAPGEWFADNTTLHFRPLPAEANGARACGLPPEDGSIEIKVRDYAVSTRPPGPGDCKAYTTAAIRGVSTVGATVDLRCCKGCAIDNVTLSFPTFDRDIPEMSAEGGSASATKVDGVGNTISNTVLTMSNNRGLDVSGENNTVTNVLVDHTDWLGTLTYVPLSISGGSGNRLLNSTIRNFGNAGVVTYIVNTPPAPQGKPQPPPQPMQGRNLEVAYCHIHHGGLIGKDSAALYTGGWNAAGLHWHHNWVHDASEKCVRGDDQSRNMTVHHNVIFNCGMGAVNDSQSAVTGLGLVLKGNGHTVYHNTIYSSLKAEMCLPSCVEKLKPFRPQFPREPQNGRTVVINSVADTLEGTCECNASSTAGGVKTAVFHGELPQLKLVDPLGFDFRPRPDSPLVGAGVVVPGIIPPAPGGKHPDIGAYQHDGEPWTAGCTGLVGCDEKL